MLISDEDVHAVQGIVVKEGFEGELTRILGEDPFTLFRHKKCRPAVITTFHRLIRLKIEKGIFDVEINSSSPLENIHREVIEILTRLYDNYIDGSECFSIRGLTKDLVFASLEAGLLIRPAE